MYDGIEKIGLFYNFPNNKIEKLIQKFKEDNNELNYKNLIIELESTTFLVPFISKENNIDGFLLLKNENKNFIPLFSNTKELEKIKSTDTLNFEFYTLNEIAEIISLKENNFINGVIIDPFILNMEINRKLLERRIK